MDDKHNKILLLKNHGYKHLCKDGPVIGNNGFINRDARKIITDAGYEDDFLTEIGLLRIIQDPISSNSWVLYSQAPLVSNSWEAQIRDRFHISSNFTIKNMIISNFYT